jgi:hypothetical protein
MSSGDGLEHTPLSAISGLQSGCSGASRCLDDTDPGSLETVDAQWVRTEGLEPPRDFAHQDLNLARLPIPPRPRVRWHS